MKNQISKSYRSIEINKRLISIEQIFRGTIDSATIYPRDLVGVLIAIAGIDRDRIGDIKVLANYSFVQLYAADAQVVIDNPNFKNILDAIYKN